MGRLTALAEIDAVTVDGYGTLLELSDPLARLRELLPHHGPEAIERGFRAEADYYAAHAVEGRDAETLARLHAECTSVFNDALGSSLTVEEYIGALRFELLPGVPDALRLLRAHGLALAVVANWDFGLHAQLRLHGLDRWFDAVITSAETGVRKPDPTPFLVALEQLGVQPARAVHVGDHRPHDEVGALGVGMRFEAAPLAEAVARWL